MDNLAVDTCYTVDDCKNSIDKRSTAGWKQIGDIDVFIDESNNFIYYKIIYTR